MSLLQEAMETCTMLDKRTRSDGRGGIITTWEDGAEIKAAITLYDTPEMRVAQAQGTKNVYRITTSRGLNLQYHDVLRRESDGKIFRVTSDGDDKRTPASARLDMRQVTAEEWALPAGE